MNRKFIATTVGAFFVFFFLSAGSALAGHSGKSHSKSNYRGDLESKLFGKAHYILKNEEELGLSEDQVQQIKDLKRSVKKSLIMQKAQIEVIAVDIKSMLYDNPVDVEGVNALVDQKYDIKKAKTKGLVESFAQLKATLSEEQWAKLKSLWKSKS
jgi:Spy/CpxP family protein refolding chaperone